MILRRGPINNNLLTLIGSGGLCRLLWRLGRLNLQDLRKLTIAFLIPSLYLEIINDSRLQADNRVFSALQSLLQNWETTRFLVSIAIPESVVFDEGAALEGRDDPAQPYLLHISYCEDVREVVWCVRHLHGRVREIGAARAVADPVLRLYGESVAAACTQICY